MPSHCSLFTGRWPFAHGVRNNTFYALGSGVPTLAERLKASGYDTSALMAVYVLKGKFGLNRGFNLYDDGLGPDEKVGNYDAEIPADRVYRKFQNWLGRERRGAFFLWVHLYDPHKPYAPREYLDMTRGEPTEAKRPTHPTISAASSRTSSGGDSASGPSSSPPTTTGRAATGSSVTRRASACR